jgi:hypothetical protein
MAQPPSAITAKAKTQRRLAPRCIAIPLRPIRPYDSSATLRHHRGSRNATLRPSLTRLVSVFKQPA